MDGWVWSNGGMILTGENWRTGRKTLYSVGGRGMDEYGAVVEWYWQGKTEVLGEKHYTAWVVDGWMSMEQWWNDTDGGKLKYWRKTCPKKFFSTTVSHVLTWIEPGSPRWQTGDCLYHGSCLKSKISLSCTQTQPVPRSKQSLSHKQSFNVRRLLLCPPARSSEALPRRSLLPEITRP